MFWNLKEASVELEGGRVDYAVFGNGKKPMVIIPGLTLRDVKGAGVGLALTYRRFAKDYRVYVIDKKSNIPDGYTVADLADDTAAVMRALGIEKAYIFGVSLGGMIAEEIAINYPSLVEKLVLGVTASRTNETIQGAVNKWIELAEADNYAGIVRDMLEIMYSEKYAKRYRWLFSILARLAKPKNEHRFIRLAKSCLTSDAYDRLPLIKCPILVLGGAEDKIVTASASLEIAEKAGCDIYMYEGLGHSAYEEAKDFNLRIEKFFE